MCGLLVLHGRCRTALLPQRRNKGASHMQVVVLPMNDSVAGCAGDFKEMKIGGGLSPFLRRAKGRSTSTIKVKKCKVIKFATFPPILCAKTGLWVRTGQQSRSFAGKDEEGELGAPCQKEGEISLQVPCQCCSTKPGS